MQRRFTIAAALLAGAALFVAGSERRDGKSGDEFKHAGLSPEQSAAAMTVPEGFYVTLAAGEPDVRQPVAFALDDRGRLWVVEAHCYPKRKPFPGVLLPEGEPGDRILIFDDVDGDGKFDKRTVFMEGLNLASGIELGFGGVWIGAAPYLLFVPVEPGQDKPAGPPQILLDGWAWQDTHETLNTFTWGPDGWLYGCHGVFTHSKVGKPGTADKDRIPINAGIWRYHPTRHVFEVFAHGTSNPWGIAFDEFGEMFIEACVIPHLYHIVQGGRYERQAGSHFNPHTYADIQTIADHRHYVGANPHGGNNRSGDAAGGHAHCGLMCYQGGAWPEEYRGKLFMGNIHGRRINMDVLKPKGSSYVASHGPDFLFANDAWARFINIQYGPDGNAWLIDWYDQQACHDNKVEAWDRRNGRIYKISYRGTKPVTGLDLAKSTDEQLVEYQKHPNEWYARHARRLLQERSFRAGSVSDRSNTVRSLSTLAFGNASVAIRLRALWSLHAVGGLNDELVKKGFADKGEQIRAWTIRLFSERTTRYADFPQLGAPETSPIVRRALASAASRLDLPMTSGVSDRWDLIMGLLFDSEDTSDPLIPCLLWFALEPLAEINPKHALRMAEQSKIPLLGFMSRRITSSGKAEALELVCQRLDLVSPEQIEPILTGMAEALKDRREAPMPLSWGAVFEDRLQKHRSAEVRDMAYALGLKFGDPLPKVVLRAAVGDKAGPMARRQAALKALVDVRDPELPPILFKVLGEPALAGPAVRALAHFDHPQTPSVLLASYLSQGPTEKRDVLATLSVRPAYANALLGAVQAKQIPSGDLSAAVVRQLRALRDAQLDAAVAEIWGVVRAKTPADRTQAIADWRRKLTAASESPPDLSHGRAVYAKACASCHILFGEGGTVGPDITGANRASLDYLLENILDSSAVIPKEYTATRIELKKGVTVICIVKSETPEAVTVVTATETLTIPKNEIESREPSEVSMMPDDLLVPLSEIEVRALIAYLQSAKQVPLDRAIR